MKYVLILLAVLAAGCCDKSRAEEVTLNDKVYIDKATYLALKNGTPESTMVNETTKVLRTAAVIGQVAATGIASAAKEIGVAANEFATTPVGKMTMFLIVWNYFGERATEMLVGVGILVVGFPLLFLGIYRLRPIYFGTKYTELPVLWGLFTRRVVMELGEEVEMSNDRGVSGAILVGAGVLLLIVGGNWIA